MLESRLIPELVSRGFRHYPLTKDEQNKKERFSPLGCMKRTKGKDLDLFDIQFDKNGKAKSVINVGLGPENARVYNSTHWMIWFSIPLVTWPCDQESKFLKVINSVIGILPEVDAWFDKRILGPHIREGVRFEAQYTG